MIVTGHAGGTDFEILEAGTHAAVCNQIVGVGPQVISFEGTETEKEQIYIRFEVPAERVEWEKDGVKHEGPRVIWLKVNATIGKKSTLRKYLESWRGVPFTDADLAGFQLDAILGKGCMISVVHSESKGKTYANINGVSKLMKGLAPMKAENPLMSFDWSNYTTEQFNKLPEWLQKKVMAGIALAAEQRERVTEINPPPIEAGFDEDDIPF